MDRIKNIINNRIVGLMAHGKSIEELENRIQEFKDYNICWVSLNQFDMMETYILDKINKKLEMVLDCCSHPENLIYNYNKIIRIPRLEKFLLRNNNNIWITTGGILRDEMRPFEANNAFIDKYVLQILLVDDVLQPHALMEVPNSLTFLIGLSAIGGAKKIILFGVDGYIGDDKDNVNSFYKPELQKQERLLAEGNIKSSGIIRDTSNFENKFIDLYEQYCAKYNISPTEIINCSPSSIYKCIPKTDYKEVIECIKSL